MRERERKMAGPAADESGGDPQQERLRMLCEAACLPINPSEALRQHVAELAAQHDTQAARRRSRWSPPFGWGQGRAVGVGALAAAALLVALYLMVARWNHGGARGIPASSLARNPLRQQNA